MELRTSFGIDFVLRKSKAEKLKGCIYAGITVNGQRSEISIKELVYIKDWDGVRETVLGKTLGIKQLNRTIENIRFRIKEKYRALEDRGELTTAESVKNAYLGIQSAQRGHKLIELLAYYEKIWKAKLKWRGFKN